MKTIEKISGLVTFLIFIITVTLGAASGYYTGNYRIGIHIGMALGLIGIMAFKLYLEKMHKAVRYKSIQRQH